MVKHRADGSYDPWQLDWAVERKERILHREAKDRGVIQAELHKLGLGELPPVPDFGPDPNQPRDRKYLTLRELRAGWPLLHSFAMRQGPHHDAWGKSALRVSLGQTRSSVSLVSGLHPNVSEVTIAVIRDGLLGGEADSIPKWIQREKDRFWQGWSDSIQYRKTEKGRNGSQFGFID